MKSVTCNKCNTVAFEVSRKYAEAEVKSFNKYFKSLSDKERNDLYGNKGATIKLYDRCWCGNPYTNFREYSVGDCPDGVTLSPIIKRDE